MPPPSREGKQMMVAKHQKHTTEVLLHVSRPVLVWFFNDSFASSATLSESGHLLWLGQKTLFLLNVGKSSCLYKKQKQLFHVNPGALSLSSEQKDQDQDNFHHNTLFVFERSDAMQSSLESSHPPARTAFAAFLPFL
eukprot:6487520-Amphidinium_carterae.1